MQKINSFTILFMALLVFGLMAGCGEEGNENPENGGQKTENAASNESGYLLQIQPEPGQNFLWTITSDDETNTQIPDPERNEGWNDVMDAFGWSMKVEGNVLEINEDGSAHIQASFPHVEVYYNGKEVQTKYNSDQPETAVNGMGFQHYFNKSVTFDLMKDGSVKNMEGASEIFAPLNDPGLNKVSGLYLSQIFEGYFRWLPKERVKIGDSWDVQHQYETGVGIVLINHCTLKNVEGNLAQVEVASQVINYDEAVPTYMEPMSISYELTGEANGTITIDITTGMPAHLSHNVNLTGFTFFNLPDQEPKKYFTNKMYIIQLQAN